MTVSRPRDLGDYWEPLAQLRSRAAEHPDGLVDLTIGAPVDPSPEVVQRALAGAADWPGYPTTVGLERTRRACVDWLGRHGVTGLDTDAVLPTIGSKELIGSLPMHLGLGEDDLVVIPALAYPTYAVGAGLAGARTVATDSLTSLGPQVPAMLWLNSPSNPTGRVLPVEHLRKVVDWCRERGTLLVSDECYLECSWEGDPPLSVLDPAVCGGSHEGILAVHSLSKRSNLAGYRCGFVAGDPGLVAGLLRLRKALGLQLPGPQQVAMAAALEDDQHVREQLARYADRRSRLRAALEAAGFTIDHSEGALYLWATRGEPGWDSAAALAEQGLLVTPGSTYGPSGAEHVRATFTITDRTTAAAVERLAAVAEPTSTGETR